MDDGNEVQRLGEQQRQQTSKGLCSGEKRNPTALRTQCVVKELSIAAAWLWISNLL